AQSSLYRLIAPCSFQDRSFLDIGAGSGLFSIAAVRCGARPVIAIDRDELCVAATLQNARRFLTYEQLSALEVRYGDVLRPQTLGTKTFDIVHAWGSLHHTGSMWDAIANAARLCRHDGLLVLAIYNKTRSSKIWLRVKQIYHAVPAPVEF